TYKSPPGVGPYGSVVASSAICQHLGCIPPEIRYHPPSSSTFPGKIHCDCHGSTYDPYAGFSVVTGPTTHPLPSLVLSYDSSKDTYSATMMVGPTIYGHTSDLSGGQAITTTTTSITTIPG
ncbi:MAG: Rieske 2Fe-2S domain-containing protein, partial [Thermoplasmatales archaeon]